MSKNLIIIPGDLVMVDTIAQKGIGIVVGEGINPFDGCNDSLAEFVKLFKFYGVLIDGSVKSFADTTLKKIVSVKNVKK